MSSRNDNVTHSDERRSGTPRCKTCFYRLEGLTRGPCPECAAHFDLDDPATYTLKPPFLWWKFWLPAWLVATAGGVGLVAGFYSIGVLTSAVWIGVPFALGTFLGYCGRGGIVLQVLLAIAVCGSVILGLMSLSLAGVFCGLILAGIAMGPISFGVLSGWLLRACLRYTSFSQRSHLRGLFLLLLPGVWMLIELPFITRNPIVIVTTTQHIQATPEEVWSALHFYESVEHSPPLLLRLGLPRPVSTRGSMTDVGDIKICVYTQGELRKQITESRPNERLAFDVVHQRIGIERYVSLIDGSFELRPNGAGTHIALTTRYTAHLSPRWLWGPLERLSARTLHEHVIAGVRRNVESSIVVSDPPASALARLP